MKEKQKREALSLIQALLDQSMLTASSDVGLTDEEVESMGSENLLELGYRGGESDGQRYVIVSILPAGFRLLMEKDLHVPRVFSEDPPKSISSRIVSTLASKLWDVAKVLLGGVVGWWLKSHLG